MYKSISVLIFTLAAPSLAVAGLAENYVKDVGIGSDPAVIFSADFESNSVSQIAGDWTGTQLGNATGGMSVSTQTRPADSGGSRSLFVGPVADSYHLSTSLRDAAAAIDGIPHDYSKVYVRYYIRYESEHETVSYHHSGVHVGGDRGVTGWGLAHQPGYNDGNGNQQPDSGERRYYWLGPEPTRTHWGEGRTYLDIYGYWFNMQGPPWNQNPFTMGGAVLLRDLRLPIKPTQWQCVEMMVEMNSTPENADGSISIWIDGDLKRTTTGFQFTDDPGFDINWVKIQNYDASFGFYVDDLVIATEYIGPLNLEVPEPGAAMGLAAGSACLALFGRRRRMSSA